MGKWNLTYSHNRILKSNENKLTIFVDMTRNKAVIRSHIQAKVAEWINEWVSYKNMGRLFNSYSPPFSDLVSISKIY